ncbi:MAG: hypothetical protein IPK94_07270 [Saprospiraceae bacterium]|nr:hypothetical protein [Saprospiraceae bacterium]
MSIGNKQLTIDKINRQSSINFTENNIGRRWEHEGMITMSWNTNQSIDLKEDDVLFTMNFTAQTSGSLNGNNAHRIAAYQSRVIRGKGELGNLSIRFVNQSGQEVTANLNCIRTIPIHSILAL